MSQEPEKINQPAEEVPFIPPAYFLGASAFFFFIALTVKFTQPEFTIIGWGALLLGALGIVAWALTAPDQVVKLFTGRGFRFGGTSIFVTLIFLVALMAVYIVVRGRGWEVDISEANLFSLTEDARNVVETLGADPTVPRIDILGFYGATEGAQRDQAKILLDEYTSASDGKINYEFIDPDRNPQVVESYELGSNDFVVVPLLEDGTRDIEKAELVPTLNQENITNAISRVSAQGDFRAYFLTLDGGLSLTGQGDSGMSALNDLLSQLKWKTREITLADLLSQANPDAQQAPPAEGEEAEEPFKLNDPIADGEVLVIAGGTEALPDDVAKVITDYLEAGGDLIVFADFNIEGGSALATSTNLANYLFTAYGVRMNNDLIIDPFNSVQSPVELNVTDFGNHPIMQPIFVGAFSSIFFDFAHSITVAPAPLPDVTTTILARSSDRAYAKDDVDLTDQNAQLEQTSEDRIGPFNLAVAAENTRTGSRVVIFGSKAVASDSYTAFATLGIGNQDVTFNSFVWATNFAEFLGNINIVVPPDRPTQAPILASQDQISLVSFVTVIVIPFGLLIVGLFVRWLGREQQPDQRKSVTAQE